MSLLKNTLEVKPGHMLVVMKQMELCVTAPGFKVVFSVVIHFSIE